MPSGQREHLGVLSTCVACQATISPGDTAIALLSNTDSTAYHGHTLQFRFPAPGNQPLLRGGQQYMFCRKPSCPTCAKSPEAFTVHSDCFALFKGVCTLVNALPRLWTMAAWKSPWRRAPPINFYPTNKAEICQNALSNLAENCDLSEMNKLPIEIVQMVRDFSVDAAFWRYVSVLELAKQVSTAQVEDLVEMPISQVGSWERGTIPFEKAHKSSLSIFKLSIDSKGIRRVDRLRRDSGPKCEIRGCFAFLIEDEENLRDVIAEFKDGLLRLVLPQGHSGLRLWNTPYPPALGLCQFYPSQPTTSQQLHIVDLTQVTALTFFFSSGRLLGIHPHTPVAPTALSVFQRFPERLQRYVLWIFLPIAQRDRIQTLGIRRIDGPIPYFNILVITSLHRRYSIGQWVERPGNIELFDRKPTTMVYGDPYPGDPISTIGVYGAPIKNEYLRKEFPRLTPLSRPLRDEDVYHSSASLNYVKHARVFYGEHSQCIGILFRYNNGIQQAVGQCRIGESREKHVVSPSILYYQPVELQYGIGVTVDFAAEPVGDLDWADWVACSMSGTITFWFSYDSVVLIVR